MTDISNTTILQCHFFYAEKEICGRLPCFTHFPSPINLSLHQKLFRACVGTAQGQLLSDYIDTATFALLKIKLR